MDNSESSIRQKNQYSIQKDNKYQSLMLKMREVEQFLNDFGFLTFGRDYISCKNHLFSLQIVSTACELTVGSIISCCASGCMADAFSLLRKYRDDLFFYLYVTVFDSWNKTEHDSQAIAKMEENIERWIHNDLHDLPISTIMKAIGQAPQVKDAVVKYNLQSYFSTLGDRLNNYVHSNGIAFYNRNVNTLQGDSLQKQMQILLKDMRYITITFMFLLALCFPISIMSTDYVDYLDCNAVPPEGAQYWVAPFITEFFKVNLDLIDKSCLEYLTEETHMEFD